MSTSLTSRATLETLLRLIDASDWQDRVKMDVKSAVRTVGRLLGGDLASIEVDVAALRRRLEGLSPESVGVPPVKWSTFWDNFIPRYGGSKDDSQTGKGRRHSYEASAG